jgi:hypothetical protein
MASSASRVPLFVVFKPNPTHIFSRSTPKDAPEIDHLPKALRAYRP